MNSTLTLALSQLGRGDICALREGTGIKPTVSPHPTPSGPPSPRGGEDFPSSLVKTIFIAADQAPSTNIGRGLG